MKNKVLLFVFCFLISMPLMQSQEITFSENIANIIYNKCTSCHRAGEVAPFSLTNYEEVASWAPMIAYVTEIKYMPPWKADTEYNTYLRENYLSDEEISMIADWVEQGAKRGDPDLEPELPIFPEGSQVGEPDLVLSFEESYTHKGINKDVYRYFAIPTGLTEEKDLVGLELRPGNSSIVHHALVWEDKTGSAMEAQELDPEYGFSADGSLLLSSLNNQLPGYVPGQRPVLYSHGMAQKLSAGSDLVLQIHYAPSSIDQEDSTSINLFFAEEQATRYIKSNVMVPFLGVLSNGPFVIPANTIKEFHGTYTFQEDVTLLNTSPHMHYLGKRWEVFAVTPEGDTANIIRINDWDFDWQGSYSFRKPVILPEGSVLHAYATYDNTAENPANPSNPPIWVTWGENTEDEMYYLPFSWVSYIEGDEDIDFEDEMSTSNFEQSIYTIKNKLYPIYPNPASEFVKIGYHINEKSVINMYITDQSGSKIQQIYYRKPHMSGMHSLDVNLNAIADGFYILVLEVGEEVLTQKLIIKG